MSDPNIDLNAYLFSIDDERIDDPIWTIKFYDKRVVICISNEQVPEPYKSMIPYFYDTKVAIDRPFLEYSSPDADYAIGEIYKKPLSIIKSKLLYYIKEELGNNVYPLLITRADILNRYWYYQIKYQDFPLCICDDNIKDNIEKGINRMEIEESSEIGRLLFTSDDLYFNNSPSTYGYPQWYIKGTSLDIAGELGEIYKEDIIVDGYRSNVSLGIPYEDLVIIRGYNTENIYIFTKYAIFVPDDVFQKVSNYMKDIIRVNASLGIFPTNTSEFIINEKSLIRTEDGKYKVSIKFPENLNVVQDIYEDEFRLDMNSLYLYLRYYPDVDPDNRKIYIQGSSVLINIKDSNLEKFLYAIEGKKFMFSYPDIKVMIVSLDDIIDIDNFTYSFLDSQSGNIKYLRLIEGDL